MGFSTDRSWGLNLRTYSDRPADDPAIGMVRRKYHHQHSPP